MKSCKKCGVELFVKKKQYCQSCKEIAIQATNKANRDKWKDGTYNNDKNRQASRDWWNSHTEEWKKEYRAKYREYCRKRYVPVNKIVLSEEDKKQKEKNYKKTYYKKYYSDRPELRIVLRFKQRLWRILKNKGVGVDMFAIIGCDKLALKTHLEQQFINGMSWDNYGEWHVDHIMPVSSFDFNLDNSLKDCFNYTNLQPLWAKDNIVKGKKILTKICN